MMAALICQSLAEGAARLGYAHGGEKAHLKDGFLFLHEIVNIISSAFSKEKQVP